MEEMAVEILKKFNQEHIIDWMNKLNNEEKNKLVEQVVNLNISQVVDLYNNLSKKFEIGDKKIEKISVTDIDKLSKDDSENYTNKGIENMR